MHHPRLSIHLRYASDLDLIWSSELGCNLWLSGGVGVGGAVCPTLTDVAAQPRRPPEGDQIEDNLRQCEQYMLTQAAVLTCQGLFHAEISHLINSCSYLHILSHILKL